MKKKIGQFLAPRILKWILIVIGLTCKKRWNGLENIKELKEKGQNWVYSLWHANISFAALLLRNQKLLSMVSESEDGSLAAVIIELFGNKTIRGSSSKGGAKVLISMIKGLREGQNGAITPDGPRGPRFKLQQGAISIGQMSGAALVPIHFEATNQWVFSKSWDKHKFPKPFSTIFITIGEPFKVPNKLSKDQIAEYAEVFEQKMMENVTKTEQLLNK